MGWSYGGFMMIWFEGTPRSFVRLRCGHVRLACLLCTEELGGPSGTEGSVELRQLRKGSRRATYGISRLRLFHIGRARFRCPNTQSLQFSRARTMNVPARLIIYSKPVTGRRGTRWLYTTRRTRMVPRIPCGQPPLTTAEFLRTRS